MAADDHRQKITTYKRQIETLSDIVEIIQRPKEFFGEIMDDTAIHPYDPLGRSDAGYPRPFPYGIWFRGQNTKYPLEPAAFRKSIKGQKAYYDERNMFHDLRLRTTDFNSAEFSNFDIMCMMRHHTLPTRVLDWTESILIAAFFAIQGIFKNEFNDRNPNLQISESKDRETPAIYAINVFRLNKKTSVLAPFAKRKSDKPDVRLSYEPGMMIPDDLDVVLRSAYADHTYYEDIIADILSERRDIKFDEMTNRFIQALRSPKTISSEDYEDIWRRARSPVGVMPKRANPRMDAQLSTFTIHGGKRNYFNSLEKPASASPLVVKVHNNQEETLNFLDEPVDIEDLNASEEKFVIKFEISPLAVKRIMIELDRIGIAEPMLFPEMDNQAEFVRRRWSVIGEDRKIIDLQNLEGNFGDRPTITDVEEAENKLYGREKPKDS